MRIGSLFAGIGGFDLAARWMGWRTAWVSEIEPYASAVLKQHWPDAPNHGDITQIDGGKVEHVDILCGGFPCQDISVAGRGVGITGARSGLWTHYARLIDEIRPRYVVAENVSALRGRGLHKVLSDLNTLGYDAEWHCIPASYVGAPHRRDRIWIVADASRAGCEARPGNGVGAGDGARGDCRQLAGTSREACGVGNTHSTGRSEQRRAVTASPEQLAAECSGWWSVEPDVGRVAHGIPARSHRLRCLGNAIVPQVAYFLFRLIEAREARLSAGLSLSGTDRDE